MSDFLDGLDRIMKDVGKLANKERKESRKLLQDAKRILDREDEYGKRVDDVFRTEGVVGSLGHFLTISNMKDNSMDGLIHSFKLGVYLGILEETRRREMKISLEQAFCQIDEILKDKNGRDNETKIEDH